MTVTLLATLDTKGPEAGFLRDLLRSYDVAVRLVDCGCVGAPTAVADVPREAVFEAAGTSLAEMVQRGDRGAAVTAAALGATRLVSQWHAEGTLSGVLGLGGSAGTTIGTSAMRALPLGVPKVMLSTLGSGQTRPYVGGKDVLMLNAVADVSGINRISRTVLGEAARAMAGLVRFPAPASPAAERPLIAATMFGVTTACVQHAQKILEAAGYEVLVFHATGNGGEAMESLIADGLIAGVLDLTTTELADELVGGTLSAGPDRLTAAGKRGVPQVISVGALDMVNFGPRATVPDRFRDRRFHVHNANVTLMRTTAEENRALGEEIGRKAAAATGPTTILLPLQGVSAIDRAGQSFDDPAARAALFEGIRATHGTVSVKKFDRHVNDAEFAEAAAQELLRLMKR